MIPLKWVVAVVAVTVGTLLAPVASEVPSTCDWLIPSESGCVESAECKDSGDAINVYEDCEVGMELFTINDTTVAFDGDCSFANGKTKITLKQKLDAEDFNSKSCKVVGRSTLYFRAVNINEFPPETTNDTVPVTEVHVNENLNSFEGPSIYYKDDDYGETESLSCKLISGDEHLFSLKPVDDGNVNIKTFTFSVNGKLDYESKVFYRVEYEIISTDKKNNKLSATQIFFIYVEDMPDNSPFFTKIVPVYNLEECMIEDSLFEVTAQDRDVDVMYDIKYSMDVAGGGEYFGINENTGEVSKNGVIDREELLSIGISTFSLTITATEHKKDGTPGEMPNNATQVTTVIIQDCNDNFPEFNNVSYAIEMYELTQDSGNKELDLEIVVSDMDEGINGSFKLTTSNPEQLSIDPENVKQSANVILTAHWISSKDNPFDYENYQDPLEFTITATEDANKTHTNTVNVTITLRDVNDCLPVFSQSSYTVNVPETTNVDSVLLTVVAEDNDVTEDYGTPSISYSLESSCYYKFGINNASGDVTLKNELDYDGDSGDKKIHCKVFARDSYGSGLATSSEITITVIDEVDYPPIIEDKDIGMTIKENSKKKEVGRFNVIDLDSDANIEFNITSSICSGDVATQGDISGWFDVFTGEPNHSEYPGIVTVNNPPDREICNEVTLTIMAVDKNTIKDTDNVNGTVVIEITDEKDELPLFVGDYVNLNIDEFDELQNPPPPDKVYIFTLKVMDPDESDTINLDVSKGGDKVELVPTTVTVAQGEEAEVEVRTKQYSNINREEDPTIEIEISLTNPTNSKAARKRKFSIKINDLNDKIPTIDSDLTSRNYSLKEDDGTESINNSIIFTLTAKDEDSESPYNIVSYYLMNIDNPNSKDQRTPFMVNATTGKVSVFLTEEKTLDRERDQTWELNFLARDQCKGNGQDADCEVLSSELYKVFITVEDVNDNQPRDLTWTPNHNPLIVDDFLKNHTELKYILEATDDDIGTNADLTYEVLGTFSFKDGENKDLFDAQSDNNICRLYSKTNFEGKMLTGWYYLTIRATDGGGLSTDFNVTLEVVDGNDQAPQFSLSGCAGEEADNIIKMEEGDYLPGVDGNPTPMLVNCLKPNGLPFTITMTDADTDVDNRRMEVKIDLANSTVENAEHGNAEEQLKYWSLEPKTCPSNCEVQLMLSHEIDHEKGTAYNLSLYARNTEQPLQETWSMVRVVVTNRREYEPYFCTEANCTYIVYIPENEPKAEAYFMEATDMDNINTGEGDDPVEQVFYFITGGDTNYFDTYSNMQNKIILKNLPNGLDREDPDKSSYSLDILATNDPSGSTQPGNSSSILHLIIRVLDKNDVFPVFKDVIFTSFMETDTIEKRLTVIEAEDLDLNETLTYTILDDIQWHDTVVPPPVTSFTIERKDSRSCYLKLDFDPKAVTQGYCNFTIHVEDAGGHTDKAQVKVYSINDDYKVSMYFSNDVAYVKETENEIEAAYTDAYGYSCVIDSITTTQTSSGDPVANETTVYMHFIDDEKNKPVAKETILQLSNNADVMRKLSQELKLHGIILDSVGQYFPPEGGKSPEDQILTLKILLAVVTLVLGCLLVLLITVSCIRTRSLKRKVHVLSTNTFGSKESGLNHLGHDVVPGSNLAQVHGNHNPVFSENDDFEMKIRDTGSISSGDSDLIGVEDNPEFKSYSNKGAQDSSSKGYENSSFGRSIDQVSAPVPGVQGGVKGNPLLNFGALQDSPMPSNNSLEREVFGDHEESASDTASLDQKINSNFSFS